MAPSSGRTRLLSPLDKKFIGTQYKKTAAAV